jgi:hypothetical protein
MIDTIHIRINILIDLIQDKDYIQRLLNAIIVDRDHYCDFKITLYSLLGFILFLKQKCHL